MHPFLDEAWLVRAIESFVGRYNPTDSTRSPFAHHAGVPGFDVRREREISASMIKATKRKHSAAYSFGAASVEPVPTLPSSEARTTRPLIERTIENAIILLVMALGKICEWTDNLPGPVPDSISVRETTAAGTRNYSPLPPASPLSASMKQSPASSQASVFASANSPIGYARTSNPSRRSSNEDVYGMAGRDVKNVDVIPGLAYYGHAAGILGDLHGGMELAHVQARLLAGLYCGQLARTIESWNWIHAACIACQLVVREYVPSTVCCASLSDQIVQVRRSAKRPIQPERNV